MVITNNKKHKNNIILFSILTTISLFASFILANPFSFSSLQRFINMLLFTIPILIFGSKYLSERQKQTLELELLWLLEFLTTSLSTGSTLESSLCRASAELAQSASTRYASLQASLLLLKNSILAQLDFTQGLHLFLKEFDCLAANQILAGLDEFRRIGGNLEVYIQDNCKMLREQVDLKRNIETEQSTKATETFLMAISPFVLAIVLKKSNSLTLSLKDVWWGPLAMTLVFTLACVALVTAMLIHGLAVQKAKTAASNNTARALLFGFAKLQSKSVSQHFILRKTKQLYRDILPERLYKDILQQLIFDASNWDYPDDNILTHYLQVKLKLSFLSFPIALFVAILKPSAVTLILLVFLPLATAVLQDFFLLSRRKIRQEQENLQYPPWLNRLTILLTSGLSLQRSLSICCERLKESSKDTRMRKKSSREIDYFQNELSTVQTQLVNGIAPALIVSELSQRCSLYQIKYVLELIVRYEREGSRELLGIITISSNACRQIYQDELQKKLQAKNILYLLPCALSLIAVIATAILPAVASLIY